ncbi:MAG: CD1375 family protein [Vagococcus sp.]
MKYTNYMMLYATHVIDGKRTIESVPIQIRELVHEIVTDALGKQEKE